MFLLKIYVGCQWRVASVIWINFLRSPWPWQLLGREARTLGQLLQWSSGQCDSTTEAWSSALTDQPGTIVVSGTFDSAWLRVRRLKLFGYFCLSQLWNVAYQRWSLVSETNCTKAGKDLLRPRSQSNLANGTKPLQLCSQEPSQEYPPTRAMDSAVSV